MTQLSTRALRGVAAATIVSIVAACAAHGKTPALLATDARWAREYPGRGFRLMAYGIDQLLLQDALAAGLALLRGAQTRNPR